MVGWLVSTAINRLRRAGINPSTPDPDCWDLSPPSCFDLSKRSGVFQKMPTAPDYPKIRFRVFHVLIPTFNKLQAS